MTPAESSKHDQFLRLYVSHGEALLGFVRTLVPSREDAREVMQQTAAVLWRKFDDSVDRRPWAFGVAKLEALAFLRDRARDRHVFGDEVLALLEAEAMEAARSSELEECLQKLPAAQRELVETAYAPGVRMDELARSAGRTPMALYKSLHRIRELLSRQNWDSTKGGYQTLPTAPFAIFTADKATASWLVNAAYAADWQAFQRDGEVKK